ncbi:M15 family metallopeptidase [Alphaproteobacteria bacterium LSUCC0684]
MKRHFTFSRRSEAQLRSLHPDLARVARLALRKTRVDFTIISARRTINEQRRLVAMGKSRTLRSRHLRGEALDFVPLDPTTGKGRFDRGLAIEVAAAFMDAGQELGTPVRWGGMWKNFEDIPHIEMATDQKGRNHAGPGEIPAPDHPAIISGGA